MTDDRRQLRAALVMNGGISLAVWMGGVTHELSRFRGSRPADSPAWAAVRAGAGVDFDIDFVAGTSAGGLNGALLATSIARGAPLSSLLRVWTEKGRFRKGGLLRLAQGEVGASVLGGEGFQRSVSDVIGGLRPEPGTTDDRPGDITLLVTATALAGESIEVGDLAGRPLRAGDHRRVYRFRRRSGLWRVADDDTLQPTPDLDDFTDRSAALELAARASAGFPFAFRPVEETAELRGQHVRQEDDRRVWLVDGGVLDNAPFGPLLAELASTPISVPAERWVVYVVPSVDGALRGDPVGGGESPPRWTRLPGRLLSLFRESDLRSDVEEVRRLQADSSALRTRAEDVLADCTAGPGAGAHRRRLTAAAQALLPSYRRSRAEANYDERLLDRTTARQAARLTAAKVLRSAPWWIPRTLDPGTDEVPWQWGISTARRLSLWMSRDLRARPSAAGSGDAAVALLAATERKLEALNGWLEDLSRSAGPAAEGLVAELAAQSRAQCTRGAPGKVIEVLHPAVAAWADRRGLPLDDAYALLLSVEVVMKAHDWRGGEEQAPAFRFLKISPEQPFPWLPSDVVRGEAGPDWAGRKLYGTAFGHFGAFGRDRWKVNDWLWGRLDAAAALASAALQHKPEGVRRELIENLVSEILAQEMPEHTPQIAREHLAAHVRRMIRTTSGELIRELRREVGGRQALGRAVDNAAAMLLASLSALAGTAQGKATVRRVGTMAFVVWARSVVRSIAFVLKCINRLPPKRRR